MKHLESWKRWLTAQEYAPFTVDYYAECVRNCLRDVFAAAGINNAESVTSDMMEEWMASKPSWSFTTRKTNYAAIHLFFRYLTDKGLIARDPSAILHLPRMKKRVDESVDHGKEDKVYSSDDLKAMLEFVPAQKTFRMRDQAIIALMAATGMRASEVAWLTVGQFTHREGNTIVALRKGQNKRKIVIGEFAIPYISDYLVSRKIEGEILTDDAPLFLTRCGKSIDRHTVYEMLRKRQEALGLRTGTHNMRYTVINAVERLANPAVARDVAGHKSLGITNTYLVSTPEERSDAVNALPWAETLAAM